METLEFGTAQPVKLEVRADGEPPTLSGYAAVFHREGVPETEYRPFEGRIERIAPGAFSAAIERKDDVRAVFNHDQPLLGRLKSGTLELREDDIGLFYRVALPDTQGAKDVAELVKRGDVSGSSFKFVVDKQSFDDVGDDEVRTIESVTLFDVGPVMFPAFEGTSVTARSKDALKHDYESRQRQRRREERMRELTENLAPANNTNGH